MAHFGEGDASFQAAGGYEGIRQLVDDFYQIMDTSEGAADVRRLYPEDLSEARDKLTRFLCGWLGGPRLYRERYGQISIPTFHARWAIHEAERVIWLSCMADAIERQDWPVAFKKYLMTQLRVPADRIVVASRAARDLWGRDWAKPGPNPGRPADAIAAAIAVYQQNMKHDPYATVPADHHPIKRSKR